MNETILIIIVIILFLSFLLHYESRYSELIYVKSSIDGVEYLVRNQDDKLEAANTLASIKNRLVQIVDHVNKKYPSEPKVKRLVKNFNPNKISESIKSTKHTSYSINKGEKIVFCIRSRKTDKIIEMNTLMFVAIHELAHVMTKSIGHTDEFWNNMKYLLKKAIKIGVYSPIDYKQNPKAYCGTTITDSPL